MAELVEPADPAPVLVGVADSALEGGASVLAAGVYCAVLVKAFDPAEDDPEAANEVEAAGPLAPDDVFARI